MFPPSFIQTKIFSAFLSTASTKKSATRLNAHGNAKDEFNTDRRNAMKSLLLSSTAFVTASTNILPAIAVDDDLTRGGVPLNPFNGLAFNYRGNTKNGLDASTLNEPSIPYVDFLKKLDEGEVEFVEFLAPNGDAAYATFKQKEGEEIVNRIRIGEGYPIEDPEGWSSPAFVVKVCYFQ